MFIFGGKKEKKKRKSYEEILKEAEERFGVPADTIKELAHIYVFNAGLPRLVRHAHPEKSGACYEDNRVHRPRRQYILNSGRKVARKSDGG
ncbi:MAG: hypothetical protein J7L37_06470 [Thermococcus sp.]|nr:hypothetical protein [Thermococcus sp.]